MILTLNDARTIIDASLAKARELSLEPMAVTVLDAGGHTVALLREDGTGIARVDIAHAKAWGSLGMGFGSRELSERAGKNAVFISALSVLAQGGMAPSPGGVLITDNEGHIMGAVGASGDTGDKDEVCALSGVATAGLKGHPGRIVKQ